MKIKVFMLYHRLVNYLIDNEIITPLNCLQGELADENYFWCELSGVYEVWRNVHSEIKGVTQYRRQLQFEGELTNLSKGTVIACKPLKIKIYSQYKACHCIDDLNLVGNILIEKYPEYSDAWERYVVNGDSLYYSNGFVATEEDFDGYCQWLFDILFEYKKRMNFNTREDVLEHVSKYAKKGRETYQSLIGGFLSERLFTLYIRRNFKVIEVPYKCFEGVR